MTNTHPDDLPHPEAVLRAAEEEPTQRLLDDYTGAIHTLRDKNYTFREIALWLNNKFNFEVDHNAVYRAYAKTVPDYEAAEEAQRDEELETEEAIRDAELNGTLVTSGSAPTPVSEKAAEPPVKEKVPKAALKKAKAKKKK